MSQQICGVGRIGRLEEDRGRGQSCGRFPGQLRSGLGGRDCKGRTSHGHVLGPSPISVVEDPIANLEKIEEKLKPAIGLVRDRLFEIRRSFDQKMFL